MDLRSAFQLAPGICLALVGAGGKTTTMFRLARLFTPLVFLTTTTHLGTWQAAHADQHIVLQPKDDLALMETAHFRGACLVSGPQAAHTDRLKGISAEQIEQLYCLAKARSAPLLIEADGAKQLPLKAPAEHEPAIPPCAEAVLIVAGLKGVGSPLDDRHVHRSSVFARLAGVPEGSIVTLESLRRVLTSPAGGLKSIPRGARKFVLLTGADSPAMLAEASLLAGQLVPVFDLAGVAPDCAMSQEAQDQVTAIFPYP